MTLAEGALQQEKQRLEAEIAKRRAAIALKKELCAELFDRAEDGIMISGKDYSLKMNATADGIMRTPPEQSGAPDPNWEKTWSFTRLDNGEALAPQDLGGYAVMRGDQTRIDEEIVVQAPHLSEPLCLAGSASRLADGGSITLDHLPVEILEAPALQTDAELARRPTLDEVERRYIAATLRHARGNQTDAAKILGISRKALWEKRKRYGLE